MNLNMKDWIFGIGIVLAITIAFMTGGTTIIEKTIEKLGVSSGPQKFNHQYFLAGSTDGGGIRATTTTVATETITSRQMDDNKIFRYLGSSTAAAITVTLPATSTMSNIIPQAGDTRTWIFENGYTAAATTTTIAAGTGIDLQEPDGQNVVIGINNYAVLTCFREANTDVVCFVDETIPAD